MGDSTSITREIDASGDDIAMWKSAVDNTYIQQCALTDDDGDLIAEQASYLVVLYRPHLRSHGGVGTSI